jgi:glycosyltransferase involved in cell wall biosynthesis
VRLVGAVWDQDLLDAMYAGAASYLHGHSVGGTNPSLLRAMVHGAPVIAYDCPYNRETTGEAASWFTGPAGVAAAVERVEREPASLADDVERAWKRAARSYVWADVASDYETLARQLRRR